MDPLTRLALAAGAWFVIHPAIAGSPVRTWFVGRFSERAFLALFSLLSLVVLIALIFAYRYAPCAPLWITPRSLRYLPLVVMPFAFVLLAGAFTVSNPTSVGGEAVLASAEPARGVLRITRHPFLWAIMAWSSVHLIVNGSVASQLFFGSMLLTAAVGTRDIDRKRRHANPEAWARYAHVTSNVPFAAILAGRNRLVLRELVVAITGGAALTIVLLAFHDELFHVRPVP
jgi:uncharacterized membrane protein